MHRQGRAGCCPVVLVGTASTARMQHHTHHSWVFPSTRFMLSSRLRSRFFLSLRFAYRRHFHVIIMFSVSRFVCLRVFCVVISLTSFMLSSCLRSLFQFFILVFHVISAMASTLMSPRQFILCDHCCVFMWGKKWFKLLFHGIAQVELCRDSALIPFSSGYARS